MKISAILILLLTFVTLNLTAQEVKLEWNADKQLTWRDFKGKPEKSKEFVATTNSGISLAFSSQTKNGITTYITDVTVIEGEADAGFGVVDADGNTVTSNLFAYCDGDAGGAITLVPTTPGGNWTCANGTFDTDADGNSHTGTHI